MKTIYQNGSLRVLSAAIIAAFSSTSALAATAKTCANTSAVANISPNSQIVSDVTFNSATNSFSPTQVHLNGQPSQPNDATYYWEQIISNSSDPIVMLSDPNAAKPTFLAPDVGPNGAALTFKLTVRCSSTNTASKTTIINVTDVNQNQPPVALATVTPAPIYEGNPVTLDGSTSYDPNGDTLSYSWTQVDGPVVTLSQDLSHPAIVTFTAPSASYPNGTSLKFKLTVSDGSLTSTTEEFVNVEWVDKPPVAQVVCPPSVDEGATGTLDGSSSTDPDDGIASYLWSQTQGGPIAVLPNDLTTASIQFTAPALTSSYDTMTFKLEVKDQGGLSASTQCDVKVNDKTPPVISNVPDKTIEATSSSGAVVSYTLPTATDAVDGSVNVTCTPSSGSTFPLGTTAVNCSAEDKAGNKATSSFNVTVQDTTPPTLSLPADITTEATGPSGAAVSYITSAVDLVDGSITPSCSPASGSTFPLDSTIVSCSATDKHGNTATGSFTVKVQDTTPPTITVPSDIETGPTNATGANVSYGGTSATDLVDGTVAVSCTPVSGSQFGFGTTAVNCSAQDNHGNSASKSFQVTVKPFTFLGFFAPVDNVPSLNTIKNGSTVPLKWKLQGQNGLEITSTTAVTSTKVQQISCSEFSSASETVVETLATGGTALRYDFTAMQFVYNWQTPKSPGNCYRLDVNFTDTQTQSAYFKLK